MDKDKDVMKLRVRLALLGIMILTLIAVVALGVVKELESYPQYDNEATPVIYVPVNKDDVGKYSGTNEKPQSTTSALVLNEANTVVLRGPVTDDSVNMWQAELLRKSSHLKAEDTIYLVLDTPGGSVDAGLTFIDTARALPQDVKTITIFAASMGFQIVQNVGERIVLPSGVLMSHRAYLSGVEGELGGELNTIIDFYTRVIEILDVQAAHRMGISLKKYQDLIHDEYWVTGFDAIKDKAADRVSLVKCAPDMMGGYVQTFQTIFGPIDVTFSKCPLIRAPIAIDFGKTRFTSEADRAALHRYFSFLFKNKHSFIREYVTTGKYKNIQK